MVSQLKAVNFRSRIGKVPPQAIDVEEEILGGILLDPNAIERVIGLLKPEAFYESANNLLYRAAVALHKQGKPIDLMTVSIFLEERGFLEKVGGSSKIAQLVETTVSAVSIDHYAEIVMRKYRRREYVRICQEIIEEAYDETVEESEFSNRAQQALLELSLSNEGRNGLRPLSEFLEERFEQVQEVSVNGVPPGIRTGFYDLDEKLNGFQAGDLIIVAGRPSMGKSAFVGSLARNVAAEGRHVALFSLEMTGGRIADRLWAAESRIDSAKLLSGNLSDRDWGELGKGFTSLVAAPIEIDDRRSVNLNHIRKEGTLKKSQGQLDLIIVDYLHLMLDSDDDNEVREIGRLTRGFKKLAGDLNVPIVLLSQLNRSVEGRADKRPSKSDLRQSGRIEEDADVIMLLYRDEYYNPDTPDRGIAEVIVDKNRNGATGTIKLLFEAQFTCFRNLARRSY